MGRKARERKARRTKNADGKPGTFDLNEFLAAMGGDPYVVPAVDDTAYADREALLAAVIEHYLTSSEFNGLPVGQSSGGHTRAEDLLRDGLVQLVTDTDYMNTHIRPWLRGDMERQVAELSEVVAGRKPGCLYPTSRAMTAHGPTLSNPSQPFRDRLTMAQGGTLDCAYFELAAVEGYLNDPAFECTLGDDGFQFADATDHATDLDIEELAVLSHAGFAYDYSSDLLGDDPIRRYWTAFLGDLADLPAKHQQRLATYEVTGSDIRPHPIWFRRQMGHWPEHIGPFHKVILEMEAINSLWSLIYDVGLFETVDRPAAWGWLLRPTTAAWNEFTLETAKLLLENLSPAALDAADAPKKNANGDTLGTLRRLEAHLVAVSTPGITSEVVREVFAPLDHVRKERQTAAHKVTTNALEPLVLNRQRDLLHDLARCLEAIREFLARHPAVVAAGWTPPSYIHKWVSL